MQVRIDGKDGSQTLLKSVRTCSHMRLKNLVGMGDPRLPKGTTAKKAAIMFPCANAIVVTVTAEKHPDPEHIITDGSVTSLTNDGNVIGVVEADSSAKAAHSETAAAPPAQVSKTVKKPAAKKKSSGTKKKAAAAKKPK